MEHVLFFFMNERVNTRPHDSSNLAFNLVETLKMPFYIFFWNRVFIRVSFPHTLHIGPVAQNSLGNSNNLCTIYFAFQNKRRKQNPTLSIRKEQIVAVDCGPKRGNWRGSSFRVPMAKHRGCCNINRFGSMIIDR